MSKRLLVPVVILVLASVAVAVMLKSERVVARGEYLQHDDFFYRVDGAHRKAAAGGRLWTATVHVENRAKRVPYEWNDGIAFVVDENGRRYAMTENARRAAAIQRAPDLTLEPGTTRDLTLAFLLPASATRPILHFWDGIFMGDVFNGAAYARTAVPLY